MDICHLFCVVKPDPRLLRPPNIHQQDNPRAKRRHSSKVRRKAPSFHLKVNNVAARPRSICADGQGGERKRRRSTGFRYERPMDEDLGLVVMCVENGRLVEEHADLPRGIPAH